MIATYAVVFEKGDKNWSAYVPDLPGCVAAGNIGRAAGPSSGLLSAFLTGSQWTLLTVK